LKALCGQWELKLSQLEQQDAADPEFDQLRYHMANKLYAALKNSRTLAGNISSSPLSLSNLLRQHLADTLYIDRNSAIDMAKNELQGNARPSKSMVNKQLENLISIRFMDLKTTVKKHKDQIEVEKQQQAKLEM